MVNPHFLFRTAQHIMEMAWTANLRAQAGTPHPLSAAISHLICPIGKALEWSENGLLLDFAFCRVIARDVVVYILWCERF
jgi:hypothetical protein